MCILVVEDDFLIRLNLVSELLDAGYQVEEASTGDEAVDLLGFGPVRFEILVTDIHMPGTRTGIDVARHVNTHWPHIPVIFTTGRPDVLQGHFQPDRGHHLIEKPYVPSQVVDRVGVLLAA